MERYLDALAAFAAIADAGSFTAAAARLDVSQSSLSHVVKVLEKRLGHRLLARTTRSVAPTPAGRELLATLGPALADIDGALRRLDAGGAAEAGTIRLTMSDDVAEHLVWPALSAFLRDNPHVDVEIDGRDAFTDIVVGRFDGGIRLGERLERDMIAIGTGATVRWVTVAAPGLLAAHGAPDEPDELRRHGCIGYRLPTTGSIHAWPFERAGRRVGVRPRGRLVFNDGRLVRLAALAGQGIARLPRHSVARDIAQGRLVPVLADWEPPSEPVRLYYPDRRVSPASGAFVAHVRRRGLGPG